MMVNIKKVKKKENKLRNKNNNTLNLDDDSFTKGVKSDDINDKLKKFFNDESSIMSNVQIAKSQKLNNNNKEEISLSLIQSINEINLDKYELFFKEIKNKDKDIEIKELQGLIENIIIS